jgi:hypothetical protein
MTQEGRIRRRFRQSRVATVELLIMVLLAGTLLGACVRSTPESGSAARPRSTPEPDSGPTKAPTPEPDSEPTPEPDSGSTPEPTPSPPDPGRERVDEAIGLLESGVVSYRPPRSMREGESEDLVVLVQRDSTQGDPEDVPGEVRWWRRRSTLALLWLRSWLERASRFGQQATSAECWAPTVLLNGIGRSTNQLRNKGAAPGALCSAGREQRHTHRGQALRRGHSCPGASQVYKQEDGPGRARSPGSPRRVGPLP